MRILFFLGQDDCVRDFDAALRALAARGHEIHLAVNRGGATREGEAESLGELFAGTPSITWSPAPKGRDNEFSPLLVGLCSFRSYLRFLRPEHRPAPELRERAEQRAPRVARRLARTPLLRSRPGRALLDRMALSAIHGLPTSAEIDEYIGRIAPDVVLFTPLIGFGAAQHAALQSAKTAGLATALLVHSDDDLTTKGMLHELLDRVIVWNDAQKAEAVRQGVPEGRVVVTGAYTYDGWFDREPRTTRGEFCDGVGLDAERPYVLYVGSAGFTGSEEVMFVRAWVEHLRTSRDPRVRDLGVLIRPHPRSLDEWREFDLAEAGHTVVWPPAEQLSAPVDVYDAIHHCAAVVTADTRTTIQSAIQERASLTLRPRDLAKGQQEPPALAHITAGDDGLVGVARSLEEHEPQLVDALASPHDIAERGRRFIARFVRPHAVDEPATPRLLEAVEELAPASAGAPARRRKHPIAKVLLTPAARRAIRSKRAAKAAKARKKGAEATTGGLRILFFMWAINYDRLFESGLRALLQQGHRVHVAFDIAKKGAAGKSAIFALLAAEFPRLSYGPAPERRNTVWHSFGEQLRAAIDFLRYLEPDYRDAPALRERAEQRAPLFITRIARSRLLRVAPGRWLLNRILRLLEHALPYDDGVHGFIESFHPDLVLVTPLVGFESGQGDYLRSAELLGVPTSFVVASWDNLTNKGVLRDVPDLTIVWNPRQVEEAVELHGLPRDKVFVTGAHTYDQWFDWKPSTTREEFCRKVALDPERPYLLYVCSSAFIAPDEAFYVEGWVRRLRESDDPRLRGAGILIRPHPANAALWRVVDPSEPGKTVVWPREGATPTDASRKADYFDSIYHCCGVVGVNTSALVESAIVDRPVFTLLAPEFRDTQEGTLHFSHLAGNDGSGVLNVARAWEEHEAQLAEAVAGSEAFATRNRTFVESFVRPVGIDVNGAARLVEAVEQLATRRRRRRRRQPDYAAVRLAIAPFVHLLPKLGRALSQLGFRSRRSLGRRDITSQSLRILFLLDHPGLIVHFDETLIGLLDRGHRVVLGFTRRMRKGFDLKFPYALEVIDKDHPRLRIHREVPLRKDWFDPAAARTRASADYLHYLAPALEPARYSRAKWRELSDLPRGFRLLDRRDTLGGLRTRVLFKVLGALEDAIPSSRAIEQYLEKITPDVVLLSPLVDRRHLQTDYVKTARAMGVPSGLCVLSWDNLTSKGMVRIAPDRVFLWNETQKREAVDCHGLPPSRIVVTGAQQFDRWFGRRAASTREQFMRRFGLRPENPLLLFVGSTKQNQTNDAEPRFVQEWITALRQGDDPLVRNASVLVRPHPTHAEAYLDLDLSGLGDVAIWHRDHLLPVKGEDRAEYFDSLHHSSAIIGINSSAMIEGAIIGRPIHTIAVPDFRPMQRDLMHFHYLLPENGGFLREAQSLEEHVRLLGEDLRAPTAYLDQDRRFVGSFIRPHGLDRAAGPILLDAIEALAHTPVEGSPHSRALVYPLRLLLVLHVLLKRTRTGLRARLAARAAGAAPARPKREKEKQTVSKRKSTRAAKAKAAKAGAVAELAAADAPGNGAAAEAPADGGAAIREAKPPKAEKRKAETTLVSAKADRPAKPPKVGKPVKAEKPVKPERAAAEKRVKPASPAKPDKPPKPEKVDDAVELMLALEGEEVFKLPKPPTKDAAARPADARDVAAKRNHRRWVEVLDPPRKRS